MHLNHRTISIFLVLAFVTRAAVPVGYMMSNVELANGLSLQLNLCPTQNNFELNKTSKDITPDAHSVYKEMVKHNHSSHHTALEKSPKKRHQEHSDNLTSQDTCHLWGASASSMASIEVALWQSDPLSLKALFAYRDITSKRNVYTRKQTRAPPLTTLS